MFPVNGELFSKTGKFCTGGTFTGIQYNRPAKKYSQNRPFPLIKAFILPWEREPAGKKL
jgi:hypothetical protein